MNICVQTSFQNQHPAYGLRNKTRFLILQFLLRHVRCFHWSRARLNPSASIIHADDAADCVSCVLTREQYSGYATAGGISPLDRSPVQSILLLAECKWWAKGPHREVSTAATAAPLLARRTWPLRSPSLASGYGTGSCQKGQTAWTVDAIGMGGGHCRVTKVPTFSSVF